MIPAFILISINAFVPLVVVFNYSFHHLYAGLGGEFVGFQKYMEVFAHPRFQKALIRTLTFSATVLAIEIPLGLSIAKFLPKEGTLGGIALMVIGLPLVLPWATIGLMWRLMMRSGQIIPSITQTFTGIAFHPISNVNHVFPGIVMMDVWHWTPLVVILFAGGYQAIPDSYLNAAKIDGASSWRIFRHIELPNLKFPMLMAFLIRFMDSFKIYAEPWIMVGNGPQFSGEFLSTHIVSLALNEFNYGLAAAESIVYLLIALTIGYILILVITGGKGPLG